MREITQPALLGLFITLLGYFIKKWIDTLDQKLDRIYSEIDKKADKEDFVLQIMAITKICEKREKLIENLSETKCDEIEFLKHSHTDSGKIVLN
jgi:hypothetical protein